MAMIGLICADKRKSVRRSKLRLYVETFQSSCNCFRDSGDSTTKC
jgi:hypothetical protein